MRLRRGQTIRLLAYAAALGVAMAWGNHERSPRRVNSPGAPPLRQAVIASSSASQGLMVNVASTSYENVPEEAAAQVRDCTAANQFGIQLSIADSIEPLIDRLRPPPSQANRLREAADVKHKALSDLQRWALEAGRSMQDVALRAESIQQQFEGALATTLSIDQLAEYHRLKQEGRIGTYAIVLPATAPRR